MKNQKRKKLKKKNNGYLFCFKKFKHQTNLQTCKFISNTKRAYGKRKREK